MVPWNLMLPQVGAQNDHSIRVAGAFGGENVPAKAFDMTVAKMDLLKIFCEYRSLDSA
jgi:hypothetical protein